MLVARYSDCEDNSFLLLPKRICFPQINWRRRVLGGVEPHRICPWSIVHVEVLAIGEAKFRPANAYMLSFMH